MEITLLQAKGKFKKYFQELLQINFRGCEINKMIAQTRQSTAKV